MQLCSDALFWSENKKQKSNKRHTGPNRATHLNRALLCFSLFFLDGIHVGILFFGTFCCCIKQGVGRESGVWLSLFAPCHEPFLFFLIIDLISLSGQSVRIS